MFHARKILTPLLLVVLGFASVVSAGEGFQFARLNPFASTEDERANASIQDDSPSGLGFPTLAMPQVKVPKVPSMPVPRMSMPKFSLFPERDPSEPSAIQRLNRNTRDFFLKTKETLSPWSASSKRPSNKPKQKGFFGSFFGDQEEEYDPPQNVNDFLSRPMPF